MSFPWCVVLGAEHRKDAKAKGVALLDARWQEGDVITVSFLDGDVELRRRVEAMARQWLTRTQARLTFEFRADTNDTAVRISFRQSGSWSRLGRYCRALKDLRQPTMNFGWLRPTSTDDEVKEVVLHEFGHALGLLHEHQNPEASIPWDRDAVIAELSGPPNNWDVPTIERNVLNGWPREQVLAHTFDLQSIMLYPINRRWTGGRLETSNNRDLSQGDIAIINEIYG